MQLYKLVRFKDNKCEVLWKNSKDGQYYFMPGINGARICRFTFDDALKWKIHFQSITEFSDGTIRPVGGENMDYEIVKII